MEGEANVKVLQVNGPVRCNVRKLLGSPTFVSANLPGRWNANFDTGTLVTCDHNGWHLGCGQI